MNPPDVFQSIQELLGTLARLGRAYETLLVFSAFLLLGFAVVPGLRRWRGWALGVMAALLIAGEGLLVWFHYQLYQLSAVVDPVTGQVTGHVAVPLWVESEKLFVWALVVAVLGVCMRALRDELLPGVMIVTAVLVAGAAILGKPFTAPVPGFIGQYYGYLQALGAGGQIASQAFQGMESARQFYYNAWYMWVHPPLLFLSYGCFAISFIATLLMIGERHSSYETVSYRWARLGYLPLTLGMLLGFPWALSAWTGDAWWWSGKVNMSLMMWLLYTAVLHARLYLRRRGMWRMVAILGVISFLILVLTYITTYVVPGAHSYAASPEAVRVALLTLQGGVS